MMKTRITIVFYIDEWKGNTNDVEVEILLKRLVEDKVLGEFSGTIHCAMNDEGLITGIEELTFDVPEELWGEQLILSGTFKDPKTGETQVAGISPNLIYGVDGDCGMTVGFVYPRL